MVSQQSKQFLIVALGVFALLSGLSAPAETLIRSGLPHTTVGTAEFLSSAPGTLRVGKFGTGGGDGVVIDLHEAEGLAATLTVRSLSPQTSPPTVEIRASRTVGAGQVTEIIKLVDNPLYEGVGVEVNSPLYEGKSAPEGSFDVILKNGGATVYSHTYPLDVFQDAPVVLLPRRPSGHRILIADEGFKPARQNNKGRNRKNGSIIMYDQTVSTHHVLLPDGSRYQSFQADYVEVVHSGGVDDDCDGYERVEFRGHGDLEELELSNVYLSAWRGQAVRGHGDTLLIPGVCSSNGVTLYSLTPAPDLPSAGVQIVSHEAAGISLVLNGQGENPLPGFHSSATVTTNNPFLPASGTAPMSVLLEPDPDSAEFSSFMPSDDLDRLLAAGYSLTQEERVNGELLSSKPLFADAAEYTRLSRGPLPDTPVFLGIGINEPGVNKDFGPYVAGNCLVVMSYGVREGGIIRSHEYSTRVKGPKRPTTTMHWTLEVRVDRIEMAKAVDFLMEIGGVKLYNPGDYGVDLGLPAFKGGYVRFGSDVCLEIPDLATATDIQWEKDGEPLPGATSGRLCIANIRYEDGGTYTATYENGNKGITYTITVVVVAAVPAIGLGGMTALMLAAAIIGMARLRRQ